MSQSLPKRERLHLKKQIDELFTSGKGFVAYPLRVVYLLQPSTEHTARPHSDWVRGAMMVSVSKRYFKRANKRNRVKRLMREAYRLNKQEWLTWLENAGLEGRLALMFVGKELPDYHSVERAVRKAFDKIKIQYDKL